MLSRGTSSLFPTTGQNSWAEDDCSVFPGQCEAEDAVPPLPFSQASLWGPSSYSADPSDRSLTNLSPPAARSDQGDSNGPRSKSCGRQHGVHPEAGADTRGGSPTAERTPIEFREMAGPLPSCTMSSISEECGCTTCCAHEAGLTVPRDALSHTHDGRLWLSTAGWSFFIWALMASSLGLGR